MSAQDSLRPRTRLAKTKGNPPVDRNDATDPKQNSLKSTKKNEVSQPHKLEFSNGFTEKPMDHSTATEKNAADSLDAVDPAIRDELHRFVHDARLQRESLTFLKSPIRTIRHFLLFLVGKMGELFEYLLKHKWIVFLFLVVLSCMVVQWISWRDEVPLMLQLEDYAIWYAYWVVLGIASSIGLGTGLHTFLLFLGPFIANTTLIADECNNINFETFGPQSFLCRPTLSVGGISVVTFLMKFSMVRWECLFWGIGTAIGELPPYFVARAARLAGRLEDEIEDIDGLNDRALRREILSWSDWTRLWLYRLLKNFGFFGILLCASVPNPLFDLAGLTCGHFLVPFWTFFGATLIGKAIVKVMIQSSFVIFLFSKRHLDQALSYLQASIPWIYHHVREILEKQQRKYQRPSSLGHPATGTGGDSMFSQIWNLFLVLMVSYFLLSLVQSLAQSHLKTVHDQQYDQLKNGLRRRPIR